MIDKCVKRVVKVVKLSSFSIIFILFGFMNQDDMQREEASSLLCMYICTYDNQRELRNVLAES